MSKFIKLFFVVLGVFGFLEVANADDINTSFGVSASISQECDLTSAPSGMPFGSYILTFDKSAITSFQINCTVGTVYTMALNFGLYPVGTQRRMISGADYLNYNIYKESTYTNLWGASGTDTITVTASGSPETHTAYGKIPSGQTSPAGSYSDTITLDVSY